MPDNENFMKNMMKKMHYICKKGVATDFMSDYVDFKDENLYYTHPEDIFKFCKDLSKRVVLRHDYLPFEFCIYVYKNDKMDGSEYSQ